MNEYESPTWMFDATADDVIMKISQDGEDILEAHLSDKDVDVVVGALLAAKTKRHRIIARN